MAKKQNKTMWGVIGVILAILGITWTIPLALREGYYLYGIPFTGIMVIIGVILVAWSFSD